MLDSEVGFFSSQEGDVTLVFRRWIESMSPSQHRSIAPDPVRGAGGSSLLLSRSYERSSSTSFEGPGIWRGPGPLQDQGFAPGSAVGGTSEEGHGGLCVGREIGTPGVKMGRVCVGGLVTLSAKARGREGSLRLF